MEVTPGPRVQRLLEEAGIPDALGEALVAAGLDEVPDEAGAFVAFLEGSLADALIGRLHPATAGELIGRIHAEVFQASGRRPRPQRAPSEEAEREAPDEPLVPTVPPPADDEAQRAYEDLASGAIHDRATPTWGLRRVDAESLGVEVLWVVVSTDRALIEAIQQDAPSGTEVIVASSMAVLKGALTRAEHPAGAVVLDAASPSTPLDRAVAALTEHTGPTRVVLWRMPNDERARLSEGTPQVRTWLPCDAEVTPQEIVQLLGA